MVPFVQGDGNLMNFIQVGLDQRQIKRAGISRPAIVPRVVTPGYIFFSIL
jgi:hypothetical protein